MRLISINLLVITSNTSNPILSHVRRKKIITKTEKQISKGYFYQISNQIIKKEKKNPLPPHSSPYKSTPGTLTLTQTKLRFLRYFLIPSCSLSTTTMGEKGESSKSAMLKHAEEEELNTKRLKTVEGEESNMVEETENIKLKTSDEIIFEVEPSIVKEMVTIQTFIEDNNNETSIPIPLPNVTSNTFRRILEFKARGFDEEFVKTLGMDEVFELILAANYLNMKTLLDILTKIIADFIKNKSVEFVRKFFNIVNDFTPEEEAKIREENAWAFEGFECDD